MPRVCEFQNVRVYIHVGSPNNMFIFVILFYFISTLILSTVLLCKHQYRRLFMLTLLVLFLTLFWYLWSPVHFGPVSVLKSEDRPAINQDEVRNWGDTVACTPRTIYKPDTIPDIQHIVNEADNVRVVGGGHSWTPLICSNEVVMSLSCNFLLKNNASTATFDAGCSIMQAQEYLMKYDKQLHGYGSIQVQTLAGAFMTALHGVQPLSFASDVLELQAVLANGTLLTTRNIDMWQGSMGMLGIVVRMTFNIYPSKSVKVEERSVSLTEVLSVMGKEGLVGMDAKTIWGNTEDVYNLRLFSEPMEEKISLTHPITFDSFLHDNILLPTLLTLSRIVYLLPVARWYYPTYLVNREFITNAWYRYPEFGFKSAAYAIPIEKCSQALLDIRQVAAGHLVTVELRYLESAPGCLSWVQTPSCIVDTSYIDASVTNFDQQVVSYHQEVEKLVSSYGGNPHWGKYYASPYAMLNMPCMAKFKNFRAEVDPSNKFLNTFTRAVLSGERGTYFASAIQERAGLYRFVHLLVVVFILLLYLCPTNQGRQARFKYSLLKSQR